MATAKCCSEVLERVTLQERLTLQEQVTHQEREILQEQGLMCWKNPSVYAEWRLA